MIAPPEGYPWPPGTVWAWRAPLDPVPPALWPARPLAPGDRLGGGAEAPKAFLDGSGTAALAPGIGGLALWSERSAFLSCVVDMPAAGAASLTPRSIVALAGRGHLSASRSLYARLNLRHGPNTSTQTRGAKQEDGRVLAEFDLAYLDLRHETIVQVWVDLIVERPEGAMLTLGDLTLSHRPRAEL